MKKRYLVIPFILLGLLNTLTLQAQKKPNVIFILTDDLGYGDVGVFFQNQRQKSGDRSKPYQITPNLDIMASKGAMFTHQYANAPVCAPSRASLLTGINQGNANVRDNQFDKALANNHTLATVLKTAGYHTMAIGKWGLQGTAEGAEPNWPAHPMKRGFEHYYGYMRHGDGHEHYPLEGLYRGKKQVWSDYEEVSASLSKCYTTDLWTAKAKKYIIDHEKGKDAAAPFFMFLAYDCPHAVLELPTQAYPKGGGVKGGLQWVGKQGHMINTASGELDSYMYPEYANATYDHDNDPKTAEVAWPETYKRYAASVRRIDDAIGDLRQLLTDLKIEDNTLIVFTSDNGPSVESYLPAPYVPIKANFFASYGAFDGIKRDCWEGGLRVPTIAAWPGRIVPDKVVTTPSMLSDWMATVADAAQVQLPVQTNGVSLMPSLTGKGKQEQGLVYVEYNVTGKTPDYKEFEARRRGEKRNQMQMIRMGDLVGVRYHILSADDDFELYNVVKDPKQVVNLAGLPEYANMQVQMKAKVLQVRTVDKVAPRPYDHVAVPAIAPTGKLLPGLTWKFYQGEFPWLIAEKKLKAADKGTSKTINGKEAGTKSGMVCYEGFIKVPVDGVYAFSLQSTGKAYLRLHESSLIDQDFDTVADRRIMRTVNLKAGLHPVKLYHLLSSGKKPEIQFSLKNEKNGLSISTGDFYHL